MANHSKAAVSLDDFHALATAFLNAHATPHVEHEFRWGEGSDGVSLFENMSADEEVEMVAAAKEWRARKFDAGFGWVSGPVEYGGAGLPVAYDRLFASLEATYDVPDETAPLGVGLGMVAPTVLAHGSDLVKELYLRGLYRGDVVGCQLFSEPGAGSDLAGVSTRAERDPADDEWVLNGQKVWTSGAQFSDIGLILCRTDRQAPKHQGLTAFVVDMHHPGVEVRPLRQMTGGASFNEVFFTDVRVPDSHRLGEVNQGWSVALTTLMNERASVSAESAGLDLGLGSGVRLVEMVRHFGCADDPVLRQELARVYAGFQVAKHTGARAAARVRAGQVPGPEMSIGKLALTRNLSAVSAFVGRVLGPRLVADTGEWGTFAWSEFVLGSPGLRIAGGSDEVMHNIIGERVLGLPKEPAGAAKPQTGPAAGARPGTSDENNGTATRQ